MKKAINFIIIYVLSIAELCAYDFEIDGLYYNVISSNTVECCGGGNCPTDKTYRQSDVTIPQTVRYRSQEYTVTKIADYAWGGYNGSLWIKNIILPETITEIGRRAFECSNLETINLPSKLTTIGYGAFKECSKISSTWILPQSLKEIGGRVFPPTLKNIVFTSANPPLIDDEAFMYPYGTDVISELKIYVPCEDFYLGITRYDENIVPLVNFNTTVFEYSGVTPILEFTNNFQDHMITLNFNNLPVSAGSYEIIIAGVIDEIHPVDIPLSLRIEKAPLTIDIDDIYREYGIDNPTLTAKCIGLKNNETIEDALKEDFMFVTSCDRYSDVGVYSIELKSKESDISDNYTVEIKSGYLTVLKAPIKIFMKSYQREYGMDNPPFELVYDGLRNNESEPKWKISPNPTTQASVKSDVGDYIINFECDPINYDVLSYEYGVLTITKAPLELKANDYSREYFEENPDFKFTLIGLRNGDSELCLINQPSLICSATKSSDVGEYDIIPSNAQAKNYYITYKEGTLTIYPANLILSATNISREYGDSNPLLKYEAIGLKGNDELLTSLIDEPVLSTTATDKSNVGEYPISISNGTSKNYTISYRQGILSVTKAPLTVIAENAERVYGENNPIFSRSYLGFKLSDTETTAFSSLPKLTCSATKYSDVGEYSIIVEGGTTRNYEITQYENGILTISQAALILKANDKSRLYYESNPLFDYTLIGLKNSDTKSCITTPPSYECSADVNSDVGQYQIVPQNAEAKNYSIEYQNGNLTINQRTLTASVGNYTRKYNTENPEFEISYSGFVNNENASVLSNRVNVSCDATRTTDVGTYPITLSGGEAINYYISKYNNGTLTIEKADQVIIWEQDLSNIELYAQIELTAKSDTGLPITYEMSPNNVATLYSSAGKWYLDCYGNGSVNIRATQNGDKNHNAASIINNTLIVGEIGTDPNNPQIYFNVETPGALPSLIADNRKNQIKNLRLTGNLNGTDINYLREMAGCDSNGNTTPGILETLDISGCTIVSGGRSYYCSYQTSNYEVSDYMFYNCKTLVNLMLPENSTSMGAYSLADCDRLSSLSIPNSISSFGAFAFRNDISLLRISMPNNLTTIGDMAFYGCNGLTELNIPQKVNYLGEGIINSCENIAKINVENGNTHFTSKDGVLYTYSTDELLIYPMNYSATEYVVPEGVSKIAPYAFVNAKKLTDVVLPSSLTNLGTDAFIGCVNLNSLHVLALNPPTCQNDCFENVSKTRCELRVPEGCYNYYWVAPVWSEFNHIVEQEYNLIENVITNEIKVILKNGVITILNAPIGKYVRIYQTNGVLIYQAVSDGNIIQYQSAPQGVIVVVGNSVYKLVVK